MAVYGDTLTKAKKDVRFFMLEQQVEKMKTAD
jgi:hypothetical protein